MPGAPAVVPAATSARITVTPLQVAHEAAKVTEYVVIARPGDQTCTVAASATPLECTITGLSPETEYQFRVASKGGWLNPCGARFGRNAVVLRADRHRDDNPAGRRLRQRRHHRQRNGASG